MNRNHSKVVGALWLIFVANNSYASDMGPLIWIIGFAALLSFGCSAAVYVISFFIFRNMNDSKGEMYLGYLLPVIIVFSASIHLALNVIEFPDMLYLSTPGNIVATIVYIYFLRKSLNE